jgi:cystathionine gamma-synthase
MVDVIENQKRAAHPATLAVHGQPEQRRGNEHRALITPLVQTATYTYDDTADLCAFQDAKLWGQQGERLQYGRYGNPTVRAVEKRIAALEHGEAALLFPTGMTAVTNILLSILSTGSHIIYTDDCYSKTRDFINKFLKRLGIESTQVAMGDYEALAAAVQPNTRLILSESPTNPYLRVADLEKIVAIAKQQRRIKTIIDATFATPVNQNPLDFGIDLVIHSGTKYLSGHNDIMAGAAVGGAELISALRRSQSAQAAAEFLEAQPGIARVWYPGLPSHPDHEVAHQQMRGFGGVVSFEVEPADVETPLDAAARFVDAVRLPYHAATLGGVETLIMQPALMSYYDLSTEERLTIGIKDNLVRLAIGIEDTADILADLRQALA